MTPTQALQQAALIHRQAPTASLEERERNVVLLDGPGIWSQAQIVAITHASRWQVHRLSKKSNRRGGKFNPESLPLLIEIRRHKDKGQLDRTLFARVVAQGTSPDMIARLTGYSSTSVKRYAGLIAQGGKVAA